MKLREPTPEHLLTLQTWRTLALRRMPYLPSVLFSLRVLDAPGLGTFAVDAGHRLYVDFDHATAAFTDDEGAQALLHECIHLVAGHAAQADLIGVPPSQLKVLNLATDLSINDDLRDGGCTMFADDGQFLLPSQYGLPDYQTPMFYYDKLLEIQQEQQEQEPSAQPAAPGPGEPDPAAGSAPYSGCGSGAGGEPAPVELPDGDTFSGKAPAAGPIERKRIMIATAAAVIEHHSRGRGTVPGGLVDWATATLTPSTTPWEKVLASHVRRSVASRSGPFDIDPSRRHRRRHRQALTNAQGTTLGHIVIPGTYTPLPSLEAIRDTSGSMSDALLAKVTGEVEAIARKIGIRGDDLIVTDVDAEVYDSVRYTSTDSIKRVQGRGGTDMRAGIAAAVARRRKPTVIVVLTDGGTPWPAEKPPIPVVVVLVGRRAELAWARENVPAWARIVEVVAEEEA